MKRRRVVSAMRESRVQRQGPGKLDFILIASFPDSIVDFRGELIRRIVQTGKTVGVMAPGIGATSPMSRALDDLNAVAIDVPLRRTGANPVHDLRLLIRLIVLLRRYRPASVLGYTAKPVIYGSLAAWFARVPHRFALITGLGFAFTGNRRGYVPALVKRLYKLSLAVTEKVFFQNRDDQALFLEAGLVAAGKPSVVVNGSGVDVQRFRQRGIPADTIRFLMIGRLLGDKGVREYAEAARILRAEAPGVEFAIAGWIDDNPDSIKPEELERWVGDGDLQYLGKLDDVRDALADCSVYVLPSYREGTPRTVLEAMSTGRAIITTDAPGCRETVVDGANGFLVPVRAVSELVDAMRRFIDEPTLIRTMGARSRDIATAKYDVRKVNEVMIQEMGL